VRLITKPKSFEDSEIGKFCNFSGAWLTQFNWSTRNGSAQLEKSLQALEAKKVPGLKGHFGQLPQV
jgi:hypothetical protein